MQELITVVIFYFIIIIINLFFFYFFLNKKHKSYLLIELNELSINLGYEYIEDKTIFQSKIIGKQLIIGNDIRFQMDISKLTELYFELYFNETNQPQSTFRKFTKILFKVSFYLSIIFSIGLFLLTFLNSDTGFAAFFLIAILAIGIISLLFIALFYPTFKKTTIPLEDKFGTPKIKLINTLYWYIPISALNSILRFTDYIRWLFSKK